MMAKRKKVGRQEEEKRGGGGAEKGKSLESTAASGMKVEEEEEKVVVVVVVELRAQEGSLVRSCMFGSIQCVHVVNMTAGILYAQQTAGFSGGKCCF